jgi:hypothetical protein
VGNKIVSYTYTCKRLREENLRIDDSRGELRRTDGCGCGVPVCGACAVKTTAVSGVGSTPQPQPQPRASISITAAIATSLASGYLRDEVGVASGGGTGDASGGRSSCMPSLQMAAEKRVCGGGVGSMADAPPVAPVNAPPACKPPSAAPMKPPPPAMPTPLKPPPPMKPGGGGEGVRRGGGDAVRREPSVVSREDSHVLHTPLPPLHTPLPGLADTSVADTSETLEHMGAGETSGQASGGATSGQASACRPSPTSRPQPLLLDLDTPLPAAPLRLLAHQAGCLRPEEARREEAGREEAGREEAGDRWDHPPASTSRKTATQDGGALGAQAGGVFQEEAGLQAEEGGGEQAAPPRLEAANNKPPQEQEGTSSIVPAPLILPPGLPPPHMTAALPGRTSTHEATAGPPHEATAGAPGSPNKEPRCAPPLAPLAPLAPPPPPPPGAKSSTCSTAQGGQGAAPAQRNGSEVAAPPEASHKELPQATNKELPLKKPMDFQVAPPLP